MSSQRNCSLCGASHNGETTEPYFLPLLQVKLDIGKWIDCDNCGGGITATQGDLMDKASVEFGEWWDENKGKCSEPPFPLWYWLEGFRNRIAAREENTNE